MYLGPSSGPPSSGSFYYLPPVYLVGKPKPYLRRPLEQILLHVSCPQAMADPGVVKVVAIAATLPR